MEDQGVQTCDFYRTDPNLPDRFNNPDCFKGYSQEKSHPLYQTSNQTYGSKKPSVHEMPTKFKGTSHQFSEAMLLKGMYRNRGFNTELDKSALSVSTETQKKRNTSRYFNECMKQSDEQETLSGFKY